MKKRISIFLSLLFVFSAIAFTGCKPQKEEVPAKEYNIIFTLATVPPVLAALDSISNGNETYAFIERGKTYNGIDSATGFHNIGFEKGNNQSTGFTNEQLNTVSAKVKALNVNGNEKFNIYVCDYTVLLGFCVAADAGLKSTQYQIVLCENGGGTYEGLNNRYVTDKTVDSTTDDPYDTFMDDVAAVQTKIATILSQNKHKVNFERGYHLAYAAATLSNVRYLLQDDVRIKNSLESAGSDDYKTKLLSVFGLDENSANAEAHLNFNFGSISDRVAKLQQDQKINYLKLMYGDYYEDTHDTLTRTTLSDNETAVPSEKLLFIGNRAQDYPDVAKYFDYADVTDASQVPDSYAELSDVYKTDFLFGEEADYQLFINELKKATNYEDDELPDKEVLDAIRVSCFNYYIDYLVTLKFTYLKYGNEYDIVLKGHPSEVLGEHETWNKDYKVTVNAQAYVYNELFDNLLLSFHEKDSVGKYIGLIPFGTAAENLAYLGVDISLCGLSSGTYAGFDHSVDIKFVMSMVDAAVDADTNLSGRYADGTLLDHDKDGNPTPTAFFNIGNLYKQLIEYYSDNQEYKAKYEAKLQEWLGKMNGVGVDNQGFIITSND